MYLNSPVDHPIRYSCITSPHVYNREGAEHACPHNNYVTTGNPSTSEGMIDWKSTVSLVKYTETMDLTALMNKHHAVMYIGLNDGFIKDTFGKGVTMSR